VAHFTNTSINHREELTFFGAKTQLIYTSRRKPGLRDNDVI